ncbi:MAG: hypothetical protein AAB557_02650 [Patescibacteria group bacterium]
MIHEALSQDIPHLVALDRTSYGDYGANEQYFQQKISSPNAKVLVAETNRRISGFVVFEVMEQDQELKDFSDLKISEPMTGKWMHIIAFTTVSNFKDIQADSKLLLAAEDQAKRLGCTQFCVPLSIDHPYAKNGVFGFWEKNGYRNAGTIKWIASPTETIDCFFYMKFSNQL